MRRRPLAKGVVTLLLALSVAAAMLPLSQSATGAQTGQSAGLERLWGLDRYETSLAVARRFVAEVGGSIDAAVLVSGSSWQDAVVASGLAGSLEGPVLLTRPDELPTEISSFLAEAGVSQMVVVGAPNAVSEDVLEALREHGTVDRVWGPNPSAASVAVAQRMGAPGEMPGHGLTAVLANSTVFADAMVAGGFSARGVHPVLLTPHDALDAEVAAHLTDSGTQHVIIMGGTAALSEEVEDDLEALGVDVTRLGGSTRLHTAQMAAEFLQGKYSNNRSDRCFDRAAAGLATAWVPFDAFSAGPLLGRLCAPLLLTDPAALDADIATWIGDGTREIVVFGGPAAVSAEALSAVSDDAALDGLLAQQTIARAPTVRELAAGIEAGMYGVGADNVLRGPGGFEVLLDDCPPFWAETEGVTADEIRIGHTAPLTGSLTVNRLATDGFQSYVNWVNQHHPVTVDGTPRRLSLVVRDDPGIQDGKSVAAVDELLGSDSVFSIMTLGTANTWLTYGRINDACVPHPFVMSNHPFAADPVRHPWTSGMGMSYSTEARLWGEWIRQNLADEVPVRVVGLVDDHSVGQTWEYAFAEWADENPELVSKFTALRLSADGSNWAHRAAAAARLEPDVLIAMTVAEHCAPTITQVEAAGLVETLDAAFATQACHPADTYLAPAGEATDGWWIATGGAKSHDDPTHADEPIMKLLRSSIDSDSSSQSQELFALGYRYGYTYVEALRTAAALPGGLTRSNFMLAVRALDFDHPLYLDGVPARMRGAADASLIEGSQFSQYDAAADELVQKGDVLDIDGQTPDCRWDYRAWLTGRRPLGWSGDVSNPIPRRFATVSGSMGEPRSYAAAYQVTDTEQDNGSWCAGLPVNIRAGRWMLTRGSWCLFYDYETATWKQSNTGGEGYVQVNGEAVLVRTGGELRLDHGDTLIVATHSGDNVHRCRLQWTRR